VTQSGRAPLRFLRPLVFGLTVLAAASAVIVAVVVARTQADQRSDDLGRQAADAAASVVSGLVAGLGGAPGLVSGDGSVRADAFDAYAQNVVQQSPAQALALVSVVEDAGRAAIEQAIGRPIVDAVGGPPANHRPRYYVVRRVTPSTPESERLVGVDIGMNVVRREAAERALETGETVISGPVASMPSGVPAFFLAKPLFLPAEDGTPRRDAPAGLVTTAFRGDQLLADVMAELPSGTQMEIRDGDEVLAATDPPPEGGSQRQETVADRRWDLRVVDPAGVSYQPAWLVGAIVLLLVGALGVVLLRGARYERRLRGGTEAMSRLADLSRELASATELDALAAAVSVHVPAILGAQLAGLAVVDSGSGKVRLVRRPDIPPDLVNAFSEIDLAEVSPIAAVAQGAGPILLGAPGVIQSDMRPGESSALAAAGLEAVALLPLTVQGKVAAVVGVAWNSEQSASPAQQARLRTVTEVCTQTLERISASDLDLRRQTGLADLARRLSATSTPDEVSAAVFDEARKVVGAVHANVAFVDPQRSELAIEVPSALPEDLAGRYRHTPLNAGIPLTDAVATNDVVWVSDRREMTSRYPAIVDDARQAGFEALVALPLRNVAGQAVRVLGLAWAAPLERDATTRSTLLTIADMTAQTYERVTLADQRLREGELNGRLARVGELLATAATTDEVVATLAAGAGEAVGAESASVGMADLTREVVHLVDTVDADGGSTGGRTLSLVDEPLDPAAEAVATRARVVREGERLVIAEPLLDHRYQPIGALVLTFPAGWASEPATFPAISRLAEVAGQALERAGMTDGERRRTSLLAAFATELSAAQTVGEVLDVVVRASGLAVAADEVAIGVLEDPRDVLVLHRPDADGQTLRTIELALEDGHDPLADAILRQETVVVVGAEDWRVRYVADAADAGFEGLETTVALPLRWADRRPLGVLALSWRAFKVFDDQTLATLHLVARLAAQALQRAALHDIEHQVVADLQERLITDLPSTPGLVAEARYRAAGPGLDMGGDWFVGLPLSEGRLGLIVGDMTGHGISAVADMAQVRAMTSALLRAGLSLEDIAEQASQFVAESSSAVATAVVAVIDPINQRLTCVVAGQVPPLLRLPGGEIEILDDLGRPLLGIQNVGTRPVVVDHPFPPGSLFLAYTDGLVERRGELIDDGIARLRQAVRTGPAQPDALADYLLSELAGAGVEDDVAFVVVTAEPDQSPASTVAEADQPSARSSLALFIEE